MKDYYKILGIEEDSSEEEIQARWIELTKHYHRDLKEGVEADGKMKEINEAYQVLKEPFTRSEYDFERAFKRSLLKRSYSPKERRFHIEKKLIFSISILTVFLILGLLILKMPKVTIQPKKVSKVVQESPKIVPKETGKVGEPKLVIVKPPVASPSRAEVEPKPGVKPSTQAISKPEIALKVEKRVPKEIGKVVVQESPKVVTKEIKKTEEPKATVMGPLPPPKTETSVKVEKPVPKEVGMVPQESPEIIPREVAKVEEPKPTAKEPLPTPMPEIPVKIKEVVPTKETEKTVVPESPKVITKEVEKVGEPKPTPMESPLVSESKSIKVEKAIPPPSIIAREEEIKQFFARYTDRYIQKDIDGFLSLFSPKAIQNRRDGLEEIRKIYGNFFKQSQEIKYYMDNIRIEIYQNGAEVRARYELIQMLKKSGDKKIWRGEIRWALVKEDGALKVLSLDYQPQKSP